jgi:hypothetical protein
MLTRSVIASRHKINRARNTLLAIRRPGDKSKLSTAACESRRAHSIGIHVIFRSIFFLGFFLVRATFPATPTIHLLGAKI